MKTKNLFQATALLLTLNLLSSCQNIVTYNIPAQQNIEFADDTPANFHPDKDELRWSWIVEPGKYDDLFFIDDELIAVKDNKGKYTVISTSGEVASPHEYDGISKIVEGVALVNFDGMFSYVDDSGSLITNNTYQDGCSFSESLGAVKQNNVWGFVDLLGDLKIECQFDDVRSFVENRAAIKFGSKWGFANNSGEIVIKPQYEQVENFSEGISAVRLNNKWGFIDNVGKVLVNFQYDEVKNFHDGFAAVMRNNKWGFINTNGEVSIDFKYDDAGNFSEGKAAVKLFNCIEGMDAWAYINKDDNIVIDFYPYDASEGRMVWVGEFEDGIAFVSKTLYCVINSQGENVFLGDSKFFVSALTYNSRFDVIPGYVFVDDKMTIRKYGLMGLDGKQRLEPVFDYIVELNNEYVIVENILDGVYKKGIIKLMF